MMRISVIRFSCVLALSALGACAVQEKAPEQSEAHTSNVAPAAPAAAPAAPAAAPAAPAAPTAAQASAFKTRNASFIPMAFNDVPGWKKDNMVQSWSAFMQSCRVLHSKHSV